MNFDERLFALKQLIVNLKFPSGEEMKDEGEVSYGDGRLQGANLRV